MKTQNELIKKLRHELYDKYNDDPTCIDDIEQMLQDEDYAGLIADYDIDGVRICSECGKLMDEGYCIESGTDYYCSDECLHKNMTEEEYQYLYDDGNGDSYWTEWY